MLDLSAKEDILSITMTNSPTERLLSDVTDFLAETGMGASYFGKISSGNSELVSRLKRGGRVWPDTEKKVRSFMRSQRAKAKESAA